VSGVEEHQVALLASQTNLVSLGVPAEAGGSGSDAIESDGVGLLLDIPNSHRVIVSVRGKSVLNEVMPLESEHLFGVASQLGVGIRDILFDALIVNEPESEGTILARSTEQVVIVGSELGVSDDTLVTDDQLNRVIESLEVVGREDSHGAVLFPRKSDELAVGHETIGVVAHVGHDAVELLLAAEGSLASQVFELDAAGSGDHIF